MGAGSGRVARDDNDDGLRSLLAAVVEFSPDAIISATPDGVITSWNAGAAAVYGYTAEEMVGRGASVLFPPGREDELPALLDRVRAGQRVERFETQRVRRDGSVIDVSLSVSPILDPGGTVTGVAAVAHDFTERIGAERAAQETRSRLAAIVESSSDAIIGKNLDGVITSWNAGAVDIYGYAAQEMIGHNVSELIPPDRAGELAPILERIRAGQRVEHFETKRVRKDGVVIDVSVSVSPVLGTDGTVTGAATVARNFTERRRAEAGRRALEHRLHQSERLESLGQLAGGIAHDFNNMLNTMMNLAAFVADETADRPGVHADAERIQAAGERAARLTKQLLIFSRREAVRRQELDLNAIVAEVCHLLSRTFGAHIELRDEPGAGLPAIEADRGQIEQVLLNLAVNARDAMPDGGLLTIGTSLVELDAGYAAAHPGVSAGSYVRLAVSDTGTGMSAEVAARIFEPFFTTKPRDHGTGLGLATVYGIITEAGGHMSVESEEGTGTTFLLYFPSIGALAPAAEAYVSVPAPGHGEMILVVDDEPSTLEVTSRILRQNGYATLAAGGYDEALALAESRDLRLLLTDSVMPLMSGPALADRIVGMQPGTAVLYMSGYEGDTPGAQPSPARSSLRIHKPFDAETLLTAVHAALAGQRDRSQPGAPP